MQPDFIIGDYDSDGSYDAWADQQIRDYHRWRETEEGIEAMNRWLNEIYERNLHEQAADER